MKELLWLSGKEGLPVESLSYNFWSPIEPVEMKSLHLEVVFSIMIKYGLGHQIWGQGNALYVYSHVK